MTCNGSNGVDLESDLLYAVLDRGTRAMLALRRTPFEPAWLSPIFRLAYDAAEALALRNEVITPAAIAAEVASHLGPVRANAVRELLDLTIEDREGAASENVEHLASALADGAEERQAQTGQAATSTVLPRPLPAAQLLDVAYAPVEFAIDPYLPRAEVTELVGAHGIFKSTAALGACLSVATGRSWGPGTVNTAGPAVFVTMEDSERTLSRRVKAWLDGVPTGQDRSDAEAAIRINFSYLAREHARDLALTATDRCSTTIRPQVVEHLSTTLDGAVIVVLETASRLHDGPELNEALAIFAQAVEEIAISTGAAVAVVRHVSKQVARDGTVDSYSGRGGGSFSDAARSVLVMSLERRPDSDAEESDGALDPVRLVHAKSTHTAPGRTIVWRPVASEHGVYLRALSAREEDRATARRLLDYLRGSEPDGVTATELHKRTPRGLTRAAAKAALAGLLGSGEVVERQEPRGRSKQAVAVYHLAGQGAP